MAENTKNTISAKLKKLATTNKMIVAGAMYEIANEIAEVAKEQTPFDLGNLMRSIRVTPPQFGQGTIIVSITAGDESATYAWPVHENMTAFHPHGKAKYLEDPLMAAERTLLSDVAARVDLRKGL